MTGEELLEKLELIDTDLIEAADAQPRKKRLWGRGIGIAACLVCVLAVGFLALRGFPSKNSHSSAESPSGEQNGSFLQNGDPAPVREYKLIVNPVQGEASADMDVQYVWDGLPEKFEADTGISYDGFLNRIELPEPFSLDLFYALAARRTLDGDYTLHDYVLVYAAENDSRVTISLCAFEEPLRCTIFMCKDPKVSEINGVPLVIYGFNSFYMAQFSYQGIYYDIEASGLNLEEMEALLAGLLAG